MKAGVEWKHQQVMADEDGNILSTSFIAYSEGLASAKVIMGLTGNGDVQIQVFKTRDNPNPIFQKTVKYDPGSHSVTISEQQQ